MRLLNTLNKGESWYLFLPDPTATLIMQYLYIFFQTEVNRGSHEVVELISDEILLFTCAKGNVVKKKSFYTTILINLLITKNLGI